jgi:hypothetical protein
MKEIRAYRLNMDIVQKFVRAAKTGFENSPPGDASSLDAGEKIIKSCPAALADLDAAGLKPREFLIVTGSLIGDVMAVGSLNSPTVSQCDRYCRSEPRFSVVVAVSQAAV